MTEPHTVGVGIVGLGFMGRTHLAAFESCDGARVVAVADRNEALLDGHADETGGGNLGIGSVEAVFDPLVVDTYTDAAALCARGDIDLVSITTPTPTHRALALMAMKAGKHVLLEKPVDLNPDVIEELAAAAKSCGVLVMPAHCMRFWPAWAWMKTNLDQGTYGRPLRARFRRLGAAPTWNEGFYLDDAQSGGALVDLHIHDVDFLVHCFGVPKRVSSTGSTRHVVTTYDFGEGGVDVQAEGGWLGPDAEFEMVCSIECEGGTMSFDLARDTEVVVTHDGVDTPHPEASGDGTGYDGEVAALVHAILSGAQTPPVTLDDAAIVARVLNAERASLEATQPCEVRR
jgi:predicted dehydrogenase